MRNELSPSFGQHQLVIEAGFEDFTKVKHENSTERRPEYSSLKNSADRRHRVMTDINLGEIIKEVDSVD